MWLTAANLGFTAGGALLYWIARRRLLLDPGGGARRRELFACALVALLALSGFALAHVGMNLSLTGRIVVTDARWLAYALVGASALLAAHFLLRLQRSKADEFVLPVAAFLAVVGLVNIYVWESRDANAYVSTVALPALREYQDSIAGDGSLSPDHQTDILEALGPVPNELEYESGADRRFATVLDTGWREAYNRAVAGFETARTLYPGPAANLPIHEVELDDRLRRQLLAAALGILLVPFVLFALSRVALLRLEGSRWPLVGAGALLLAIVGAVLLESGGRTLPALVQVGGHSVTVYELVKLGLVVVLALCLAHGPGKRRAGDRSAAWFALAAAGLTVAVMIWRDPGAGIALLAVAVVMTTLVVDRRWTYAFIVAGVVAVGSLPVLVRALGPYLPETVNVRMAMWSDPWGTYQRAELQNQVTRSLGRIVGHRLRQPVAADDVLDRAVSLESQRSVSPVSPTPSSETVRDDVDRVVQELRWRLAGLQHGAGQAGPLIPGADPVEELLLLEAETLWSDLRGSRSATASAEGMHSFQARVDDALGRLQANTATLGAEPPPAEPGAPLGALAPDNFQLQRSLFALREGSVFGVGLGLGRPEAVPGLTEDVPLASLGEALGLVAVLLVALFVLLLTGRGVELARRQTRPLLALLAVGLASLLGLQALISIGGLSGVVPFTGLTFPFLSRGGTALVANFVVLALLMAIAARSRVPRQEQNASGPLLGLVRGAGFPVAFALVLASVALVQLAGRSLSSSPALAALPDSGSPFLHPRNQWDAPSYRTIPGPVVDRHGKALAETRSLGGDRVYPDRALGTALGHTLLGLDLAFRDELVRPERSAGLTGPVLVTTIDSGVQRAVHEAIDEGALEAGLADVKALRGAVVVLDATNGEIVALESRPTFALAELADPAAWASAEARERRAGFAYRYLNRAVFGFYPPGSIFKTVTAAAALERGFHSLHSPDFDYRYGPKSRRAPDGVDELSPWHQLTLPDGPPITTGNHPQVDEWLFDLEEAFAWSCNVAFAEIGLEIGAADLLGFARRFGFERPVEVVGLGTATSTLDNDFGKSFGSRYFAQSASNLARTAFGQGQARVTPLQMALVPAAIAQGGKIMQPHIVAGWRSSDGRWLRRYRPGLFSDTGLSELAVGDLREMMWASATWGWAGRARVNPNNAHPGVAGKTGSAEWSDKRDASHAWFIGYYPAESPRLALAVVVERGGAGPTLAARIARRIFAAEATERYVREAGTG